MEVQPRQNNVSDPKWKILVIDDDEDDYFIVKEMLNEAKGRKFVVHWAATYDAGREELANGIYDAVLVDYDLGLHSGIELIREANEKGYPSPLILFTGRGNYEVDVEAMQAGATLYLTKSEANPLLLERAIRYAIEIKQKEQILLEREAHLRASEAQLRESEARERARVAEMDAILDAVPAIVWLTHDPEARVVTGNRAAYDFQQAPLGNNISLSSGEGLPQSLRVFRNGKELSVEELPLQQVAASGKPLRDYEEEVVFEDGRRAVLLGNVTPLLDDEGQSCGAIAAFIDITERKRAESNMRKSERAVSEIAERFKAVLENSLDVAYRRDLQADCYDYMSPVVEQIIGFTADEMMGMSTAEALSRIHPDDLPEVEAELARAVEQGKGRLEYRFKCKNGVYRWMADYITVSCDKDGTPLYRTGILRDMEETRQYKDLLERLLQAAPVGIAFMKGPRHIYDLLNETFRQFARGKGELIGRPAAEVWPEIADVILPQMNHVYQTGEPFSAVNAPLTVYRDGIPEEVYFTYSHTPIYQSEGRIEGVMTLMMETTEVVHDRLALEAQTARLEAMLQALPVGVWITDQTGQILTKNKAVDQIWSGDAPLLHSINEYPEYTAWFADSGKMLAPEDYPVPRALKTSQPVEPYELTIQRFDGSRGTVLASAAPIQDSEGRLAGTVCLNVEITERKRVENALRESEERFRQAIENMLDAVGVYEAVRNAEGEIVDFRCKYVNQVACQLNRMGKEQQEGHLLSEYLPAHRTEGLIDVYAQVVESGEPFTDEQLVYEDLYGDGRRLARAFEISVAKLGDGIVATWRDVTERKQVEQALRKSEGKMRAVFQALVEGIVFLNQEGQVEEANDAVQRTYGHTLPELVEPERDPRSRIIRPDGSLFPEEEQPAIVALRTGEAVRDVEMGVPTSDGGISWRLVNAQPVYDDQGTLLGAVASFFDITERKRAEHALQNSLEKLARSNEELEQFAFVASHDLQEPLRKIHMFGNSLRRHTGDSLDPTATDYLDRMQNAANRMQAMINGLLELSRVNRRGGSFLPINLTQVVKDVVSDLETSIQGMGGQVQVEDLPAVEADELQMRQLFQNLIGNAIKFHKPGEPPVVRVSGAVVPERGNKKVEIRVKDNGVGFDAQHAERIFQPFIRLHGRSEYEGTGLGLSICQKIVERHHGKIEAQSAPGEGTTFIIRLPQKPPQ